VFEDNDEALRAEKRICLLKHELRLPEYCEIHFSKHHLKKCVIQKR